MNKSESKYFNTAVRMDEAFLALLEKKSFAYITVKELCEKAGVNRSTFYLHYETMADLEAESMEYLSRQFMQYMQPEDEDIAKRLQSCPVEELYLTTPKYLRPYLTFIQQYKRLFAEAESIAPLRTQETYSKLFRHVFSPILERFNVPENERRYMMEFYIRGLVGIVNQWLRDDCKDSIDHVIDVIRRCVRDGSRA